MPGTTAEGAVTLHFFVFTRTQNWLRSSAANRRYELREWISRSFAVPGVIWTVTDDKGALVRFTGGEVALGRVREWAAAHPRSVRVLP